MRFTQVFHGIRILFIALISVSFLLCNGCRTKATVLTWDTAKNPMEFPEASLGLPPTGVCFSGGGTRAMNCAIGQMRGLQEAGLFDDIGYVSAVSGGSWATTIFMYYQSGAANDEQLLGTIIPPNEITMDTLQYMPPGFMGEVITRSLEDDLFERLGVDIATLGLLQKMDYIWIDGVGHTYLKPFGLYDPGNPKYFTLNDESRDDILRRNPKLKKDDFITVHERTGDIKRPYMVLNSSLLAPAKDLPLSNPENLSVFNYTPLYIGSNQPLEVKNVNLISNDTITFNAGGGFIESFGFGSSLLHANSKVTGEGKPSELKVKLPKKPFEVVDATGTSSAAFGAIVSSNALAQLPSKVLPGFSLNHLIPEQAYWPTLSNGTLGTEEEYRFTDGGNLENYGLITLLQRGVKRVVVFINTDTPLTVNCNPNPECPPLPGEVDSDLYPLFGYPTGDQINNQVFNTADFAEVYKGLSEAKLSGGTVMTKTNFKTKENLWWGIPQGHEVEILWVYNEHVPDWESQLRPEVQDQIHLGPRGTFPSFPLYELISENGFSAGISLTKPQVNLLYQLSAWNVYHNQEAFQFLKDK